MKKRFKASTVQESAHMVFDQFVLVDEEGKRQVTDLSQFIEKHLKSNRGVQAIQDELINSGLLRYSSSNQRYEHGWLGLELKDPKSGRYLGYLKKEYNKYSTKEIMDIIWKVLPIAISLGTLLFYLYKHSKDQEHRKNLESAIYKQEKRIDSLKLETNSIKNELHHHPLTSHSSSSNTPPKK